MFATFSDDDFTKLEKKITFCTFKSRPSAIVQGPLDALYIVDFEHESIRRIAVSLFPVIS